MLRSGSSSRPARFLGYVFAVACALILAYSAFAAVWVALTYEYFDPAATPVWVLAISAVSLALVVIAAQRIERSPRTGGYVRLALVCLGAALLCFVSWSPFVTWI